jgi:hypothetical protein
LPDLRADCRLRAKYFLSRARKAALARYLEEGNELIEIHLFRWGIISDFCR